MNATTPGAPSDLDCHGGNSMDWSGSADGISAEAAQPNVVRHNFIIMTLYQVTLRCGWIFKTESIVIPAIMHMMGAPAWLRGCLPLINRFGQSVPPMLCAALVTGARKKKHIIVATMLVFSGCFYIIAMGWKFSNHGEKTWMQYFFLGIYCLFFMGVGIHNLSAKTIQGKLIRANLRGRLMLTANVCGVLSAVLLAYWLLPEWLQDRRYFFHIFIFTASLFLITALIAMMVHEPPDQKTKSHHLVRNAIRDTVRTLSGDARFRRIAVVAALANTSLILFPHYQPVAADILKMSVGNIMIWVIAQNIGLAIFSLILGPMADFRGNRAVLQILLLGITLTPVLTMVLTMGPWGARYYWMVFVLVGLTPVTIGILQNYALELTLPEQQPRYLATLSICSAIPIIFSPVASYSMDLFNSPYPLFTGVTLLLATAWLLSFRLPEPRNGNI